MEIEGSEEFVSNQIDNLATLSQLLKSPSKGDPSTSGSSDVAEDFTESESDNSARAAAGATFGEWMHGFKSDLLDIDKALITARYVQSLSSANDFKTSEVNKALKDHGIKLSNPSKSLAVLATKKYLFQTRKVGKLKFMRVSTDGQDHLSTLKREK